MILIMCPKSKSGKGKKLWPYWKRYLSQKNATYNCIETRHAGDATSIAFEAEETVVAVGGDGTINEVINGTLSSPLSKAMGVLYSGTSPDFCKFHNIPTDPKKSIITLLKNTQSKVDVIKIKFHKTNNTSKSGFFASSCNIGLGADVAKFANKHRKHIGDTLGTLMGILRAILIHKPRNLDIKIDNHTYKLNNCNHLIIIKNPNIASGLKLQLDIKNNDGKGYILAICNRTKFSLLRTLPKLYSGKITKAKDIFIKPFNNIKIECNDPSEIEFDGDPQGLLPLEAEVLHQKLNLIGAKND